MSTLLPSHAYRITPRRDVARPTAADSALRPGAPVDPDAGGRSGHGPRQGDNRQPAGGPAPDRASARRAPLMQALLHTLGLSSTPAAADDEALERALIAFARALNHATHDVGAQPQPAAARADEAARRRAAHETQLLAAFGELLHTVGRPLASPQALQEQLGAFLHRLARQLDIDDEQTGEATRPGSLIDIRA